MRKKMLRTIFDLIHLEIFCWCNRKGYFCTVLFTCIERDYKKDREREKKMYTVHWLREKEREGERERKRKRERTREREKEQRHTNRETEKREKRRKMYKKKESKRARENESELERKR